MVGRRQTHKELVKMFPQRLGLRHLLSWLADDWGHYLFLFLFILNAQNVFRKLRGRKTLLQQGQIEKFSVSFVSRKLQSEGGPADVSRLQVLTIVQ